MANVFKIYPKNDFDMVVPLKEVIDGKVVNLTEGIVTAFIAITNTTDATAADPDLECEVEYLSGANWQVTLDASLLTLSLLDGLFGDGTQPWLIVEHENGVRLAFPGEYVEVREGLVA